MAPPHWNEYEKTFFINKILPRSEYATGKLVAKSGESLAQLSRVMTDHMYVRRELPPGRTYNGDGLYQYWRRVIKPDVLNGRITIPPILAKPEDSTSDSAGQQPRASSPTESFFSPDSFEQHPSNLSESDNLTPVRVSMEPNSRAPSPAGSEKSLFIPQDNTRPSHMRGRHAHMMGSFDGPGDEGEEQPRSHLPPRQRRFPAPFLRPVVYGRPLIPQKRTLGSTGDETPEPRVFRDLANRQKIANATFIDSDDEGPEPKLKKAKAQAEKTQSEKIEDANAIRRAMAAAQKMESHNKMSARAISGAEDNAGAANSAGNLKAPPMQKPGSARFNFIRPSTRTPWNARQSKAIDAVQRPASSQVAGRRNPTSDYPALASHNHAAPVYGKLHANFKIPRAPAGSRRKTAADSKGWAKKASPLSEDECGEEMTGRDND